uniref:Protein kinase domain-containing protein n=1 Tax=Parastrongyloides trichosuri TaxID=131310 RepID=A0A0N4ZA76_PARTI
MVSFKNYLLDLLHIRRHSQHHSTNIQRIPKSFFPRSLSLTPLEHIYGLVWMPKNISDYQRELLYSIHSLPFYFGSLLEDDDVQVQLLINCRDCFLSNPPQSTYQSPPTSGSSTILSRIKNFKHKKCYHTFSHYILTALGTNEIIIKANVIFKRNTFVLEKLPDVDLHTFIAENNLNMISRPWFVDKKQIVSDKNIKQSQPFILSMEEKMKYFKLGTFVRKVLIIDNNRRIPVSTISLESYDIELQKKFISEANWLRNFGNVYIEKLWGLCSDSGESMIILEEVVYGSLVPYLRNGNRNEGQLIDFCYQICKGLRYLEDHDFLLYHFNIYYLYLTYNYTIKIAIIGSSKEELIMSSPKELYDSEETIVWLPPECFERNGTFNFLSLSYIFGNVIWSIFNNAETPMFNMSKDNNRKSVSSVNNKNFTFNSKGGMRKRELKKLKLSNNLISKNLIKNVLLKCWDVNCKNRPNFTVLCKEIKKLLL